MSEELTTAAQIIRDQQAVTVTEIHGVPVVITPGGFQVEKFPELAASPKRTFAFINAHDVTGFIDYINQFKLVNTAIFAALQPQAALSGVIDYHSQNLAAWCTHRVNCDMAHSEEWKRWSGANKTKMDQRAFGVFLEDNLKDVTEPSGADLLSMALNFSSARNAEFKSSIRLADGTVQFSYVEDEKAGQVRLPARIVLTLPVFRGEGAYLLAARLKYHLKGAEFSIWYELDRPDLVLDTAYADVIARITAATGIAVFRGATA